jgi:hypothetical protein
MVLETEGNKSVLMAKIDMVVLVLQRNGVVQPSVRPRTQCLEIDLHLRLPQCFKQPGLCKHILSHYEVCPVRTGLIDTQLGSGVTDQPRVDDNGVLKALLTLNAFFVPLALLLSEVTLEVELGGEARKHVG